jgi:Txe/YoeB family toxin of toxin-antitoxin system
MSYQLYYTPQALEDWEVLKRQENPSLAARVRRLLNQVQDSPFAPYPPYKKLSGELCGLYARRVNLQHRLIYHVLEEGKAVKVVSMWTHYGD